MTITQFQRVKITEPIYKEIMDSGKAFLVHRAFIKALGALGAIVLSELLIRECWLDYYGRLKPHGWFSPQLSQIRDETGLSMKEIISSLRELSDDPPRSHPDIRYRLISIRKRAPDSYRIKINRDAVAALLKSPENLIFRSTGKGLVRTSASQIAKYLTPATSGEVSTSAAQAK